MSEHNRFNPALIARQTIYAGVKMRSRLEGRFAAGLDKLHVPWDYEPRAFADSTGQYLPDFQVFDPYEHDRLVYIEVKPVLEREPVLELLERMRIIWASEPNADLVIASPVLGSFLLCGDAEGWSLGAWFNTEDSASVTAILAASYANDQVFSTHESVACAATMLGDGDFSPFDWGTPSMVSRVPS